MSILDTAAERDAKKRNKAFKEGNLERRAVAVATSKRKMREALKGLEKFGDVLSEDGVHSSLQEKIDQERSAMAQLNEEISNEGAYDYSKLNNQQSKYSNLSAIEINSLSEEEYEEYSEELDAYFEASDIHFNNQEERLMKDLGYSYIYASTGYTFRSAKVQSSDSVTGYSGWVNSEGRGTLYADKSSFESVVEDSRQNEYIEGNWIKIVKKGEKQNVKNLEKKVRDNATTFFQIKNGKQKESGLKEGVCILYNVFSLCCVVLSIIFMFFTGISKDVDSDSGFFIGNEMNVFSSLLPKITPFILKYQYVGYIALLLACVLRIVMAIIYQKAIKPYEATDYKKRTFRFSDMVTIIVGVSILLFLCHLCHFTKPDVTHDGGLIEFLLDLLLTLLEGLLRIPFAILLIGSLICSVIVIIANNLYSDLYYEASKRNDMITSGKYEECLEAYNELHALTIPLHFEIKEYDVLMQDIS